jgi:hypothetical protein
MQQAYSQEPRYNWAQRCRSEFDLTPLQLGCLMAIVLHYAIEYRSVSVEELHAFARQQPSDYELCTARAPSELWKLGLVERFGPPNDRRYYPTVNGVRRLRA